MWKEQHHVNRITATGKWKRVMGKKNNNKEKSNNERRIIAIKKVE